MRHLSTHRKSCMPFAYSINHFVYYVAAKQSGKEKKLQEKPKTEEETGWQTESKQLLQKFAHGKEQPTLLQLYKCTRQQATATLLVTCVQHVDRK